MKKIIIFVILALSVSSFSETSKTGFVNVSLVIGVTKEGKRAKKSLEKFFNKRKKILQREGKKLEAEFKALQKQRGILSKKAFEDKVAQHQMAKVNYDKSLSQAQTELQKKERDLTLPMVGKIQKIIEDYSKKHKYVLVLNKEVVLYSKGGKDLTGEIIKAYNKKHR